MVITQEVLEKEIKKGEIKNSYIFCGADEELIKEAVYIIKNRYVDEGLQDLNYAQFDGVTSSFDEVINACETLPFMTEKKVVLVYRANYLKEKTNSEGTKNYETLKKYLKDIPEHCILILYYLFDDKRDTAKKNKKLMSLEKLSTIVQFDKLKGDRYYKKIDDIFKSKGLSLGKIELKYFADRVQNNFDIITREADKIVNYTYGREVRREDIDKLVPKTNEEDIFDLIELISQKKIERALGIVDELLEKSEQHMLIVISMEKAFKRLYDIKSYLDRGDSVDKVVQALRLPEFVVKKLIQQSKGFSKDKLIALIKLCLDTENKLKSSSIDKDMEIELLLLNTLIVK